MSEDTSFIENLFEQLDNLYESGDPDGVETFLKTTLLAFEVNGEDNRPEYVSLLNELAGFYRGVSRYAESAEEFGKALALMEEQGQTESPAFANILMNLAGLFRLMGESENSRNMFLRAKQLMEASVARDDYAYASVLNNLSLAYQETGELDLALDAQTRSLELIRSGVAGGTFGSTHEIATALNNLAAVNMRLGHFDEAETYIRDALNIYAAMPEENIHHAAALTTYATVKFLHRDYDGAIATYEQSLPLTERFFGKNIEYAYTMRNLATAYEALGDIPAALGKYAVATEIIIGIFGEDDARTNEYRTEMMRLETKIGADSGADSGANPENPGSNA
jgi:tetratricopeptide (TPR) repeat protein